MRALETKGKLYIVGFGPGNEESMTAACKNALLAADIIVGYTGYIGQLRPLFKDKVFYETGMRRETERCRMAIELAAGGKTVCIVSSGDSGVYGMASPVFELAEDAVGVDIEVISGVTAALSGAALLGAPLGADFTVISLSDLLTPWATIERRLRAAAAGDFAVCLYNPGSKKRADALRAACDILLETMPKTRLCGVARQIGRPGQTVVLTTLGELRETQAGMEETVFIGASATRNIGGRMVTPRGYRNA